MFIRVRAKPQQTIYIRQGKEAEKESGAKWKNWSERTVKVDRAFRAFRLGP